MKKAILYSRFSPCPGQDSNLSNERQEERCKAYCDKNGYEVLDCFRDNAVSGTILVRPALTLALEALGPDMVLVVDRCDRLARDVIVDLTIRQKIKATGALLEFADGSPNDDSPEGRLVSGIFALFASYERDRIAARTSAGLRRKQASGEFLGRPPVGFQVDPDTKRLIGHDGEQAAILAIKRLSKGKLASDGIARCMTRTHGLFRGRPWSARTIRKILKKS